jgi:tetratricopeptide (TPR) repeat protein
LIDFALGFLAISIVLAAIFYLPNYIASEEYLVENVLTYYGFPNGLKSIDGFLRSVYTFDLVNLENKFFIRLPIISLSSILCLIFYGSLKTHREKSALIFFASWFIFGFLFLSPWNYRPIRYELYLFFPMAALASIFLRNLILGGLTFRAYSIIVAIFPFSLAVFQVYFAISHASQKQIFPFGDMVITSLLVSIPLSGLVYFVLKRFVRLSRVMRLSGVLAVLVVFAYIEIAQYSSWYNKMTFAVEYVNNSLPKQVGDEAIIMGPYAQTFTLSNPLRAEIFYFGAYPKNDSLFEVVPATHVIFETGISGKSGTEVKFEEYYKEVYDNSFLIDSFLIGRYYILLYNISGGPGKGRREWSNFELAKLYYNSFNIDSALCYFDKAALEDRCSRASLYKGNIYFGQNKFDEARIEYSKGLMYDCYDPKFWALYSVACRKSGNAVEGQKALAKALKYEPYPGFLNSLKF